MQQKEQRRKESAKQEVLQRILEKQRTIAEQESEIDRLKNSITK